MTITDITSVRADRWHVLAVLIVVYGAQHADRFSISTAIEPVLLEWHPCRTSCRRTCARQRGAVLLLFTAKVANLLIAPQLVGWLSDWFAAFFGAGQESLRRALLAVAPTGF